MSMFGFGRSFSLEAEMLRVVEDAVRRNLVWDLDVGPARFDLRADGLDLAEWDFPRFLTAVAPGHPGFHVAGEVEDPEILGNLGVTIGFLAAQALRAAEDRGAVVLWPGDFVRGTSLKRVIESERDPDITHPADREMAVLTLTVERGGDIREGGVVWLRRRGWLSSDAAADDRTLAALSERVPEDADPAHAGRVSDLRTEISALKRRLDDSLRRSAPADAAAEPFGYVWHLIDLDRLANLAARYGYEQARLEVATKVEPLARATLARQEQARRAGRQRAIPGREAFIITYLERHPAASNYEISVAYINTGAEPGVADTSVERSVKRIRSRIRADAAR